MKKNDETGKQGWLNLKDIFCKEAGAIFNVPAKYTNSLN